MTMKKNLIANTLACTILASLAGACAAAERYKDFTDEITCGKLKLTLESSCAKGEDDTSLNTCKPQKLRIANAGAVRNAVLPELNAGDIKDIKAAHGVVGDLFVIKMGCAQAGTAVYPVLYYSVGGGNAPYAEFWTAYDAEGKLMATKKFPLNAQQTDAVFPTMKKVHSIMPK